MAEVAQKKHVKTHSRTQSIAFIALSIAVITVSAWVTVPLGPIPFTLQMFAITFAIVVLTPMEAMCAILGYLLLGAIGVPVFSSMRGGLGVLAGPTGGFLWGYILGVAIGAGFLFLVRRARSGKGLAEDGQPLSEFSQAKGAGKALVFLRNFGFDLVAGVLFTAIAYACGCVQYMAIGGVDLWQAFLVCCAPFIVVDLCKIVAAVIVAETVRTATNR